ncbi:MAG TPA: ATP-binding protein [Spirochaetia bacterium]|nr:ATP-binding protein [Spirochaetia bacterium]
MKNAATCATIESRYLPALMPALVAAGSGGSLSLESPPFIPPAPVAEDGDLARLREALAAQREQLMRGERMASLGVLTASVAHEINNPAHVIRLNVDLLEEAGRQAITALNEATGDVPGPSFPESGEEAHRWGTQIASSVRLIRESAVRIEALVEELKAFARGEACTVVEPVSMNDVVESVLRLSSDFIRRATSRLSVCLCPGLPRVRANFGKLQQLVLNLVENSCQALTDPCQGLSLRTSLRRPGGLVVLQVEDAGRGIAEKDLPRVTEPFFTTRNTEGGTGLGLAIAAEIVRQFHGILDVRSDRGRGTVVTVTFSAAQPG